MNVWWWMTGEWRKYTQLNLQHNKIFRFLKYMDKSYIDLFFFFFFEKIFEIKLFVILNFDWKPLLYTPDSKLSPLHHARLKIVSITSLRYRGDIFLITHIKRADWKQVLKMCCLMSNELVLSSMSRVSRRYPGDNITSFTPQNENISIILSRYQGKECEDDKEILQSWRENYWLR